MLADLIWFTVLGCGLAQNSLELDYQQGKDIFVLFCRFQIEKVKI